MTDFGFEMKAEVPKQHRWWPVAVAVPLLLVASVIFVAGKLAPAADFTGEGDGSVKITVEPGQTLTAIGHTLEEAGVIASTDAWLAVVAADEAAAGIGPGDYDMHLRMSARAALDWLLDPTSRAVLRLVVNEGDKITDIVSKAAKLTGIPKDEFYAALRQPSSIGLPTMAGGKPEGYLFPATYEIEEDETATAILQKLTKRWKQAYADLELNRRAAAVGRSVDEILIIASILEQEVAPEDYAKAARVIENRLALPMRLQLDSTVNYALGIEQLQLSADQLAAESAYNTYKVDGLPPTPIGNPGEAAIEAALEPAKGPWLYFVTVDPETRLTKFCVTYEDFLKLKEEFKANVS